MVSITTEERGPAVRADYGQFVGIPNEFENLPGMAEAARAFQDAIAEDTSGIEAWLSGRSAMRVVVDHDLDNDLLQRARAELDAALGMIDELISVADSGEERERLEDTKRELVGARDSNNISKILQLVAGIRSGQTLSGKILKDVFEQQRREAIAKMEKSYQKLSNMQEWDWLRERGYIDDKTYGELEDARKKVEEAKTEEERFAAQKEFAERAREANEQARRHAEQKSQNRNHDPDELKEAEGIIAGNEKAIEAANILPKYLQTDLSENNMDLNILSDLSSSAPVCNKVTNVCNSI